MVKSFRLRSRSFTAIVSGREHQKPIDGLKGVVVNTFRESHSVMYASVVDAALSLGPSDYTRLPREIPRFYFSAYNVFRSH